MDICEHMVKKLLERFTKKNCKKQIKKNLGYKKQLRETVLNYMLNGYDNSSKALIIHLIVVLTKAILLYKVSYFPEPYTHSKNKIKVKLDFLIMKQSLTQQVLMH